LLPCPDSRLTGTAGGTVLTDLARDTLFTIGWFGLLSMVSFGWAQEDPPAGSRLWLGAGSAIGAAWWVAVIVGAHLLPLAWLLGDLSIVVFGVLQLGALGVLRPLCRGRPTSTSRVVGPVTGISMLSHAAVSAVVW
jgi:hypothetical protein